MKIEYDYQIFSGQRYGGISRYFFELARHISCGTGVSDVLINSPVFVNQYLEKVEPPVRKFGVPVPFFRGSSRAYNVVNEFVAPFISQANNADVYHETYYSRRPNRQARGKIVLTVYDMIHELFSETFSANDKIAELKKLAVQRASHIICISESTQRDLIRLLDVPAKKTSVIHLGFSLTCTTTGEAIITKDPYLLYVGHRSGYKNFSNLLLAYAGSAWLRCNFRLVAFGGFPFSTQEKQEISALGLDGRILHVAGSDEVLAGYYQNAALFIYPSLYEGFGIPPLEAMSYGCPVVCSNTSSIPEVVDDAAKIFDPKSPSAIASAICELLQDDQLRNTYIERGHKRVQYFSWQRCAAETLALYKSLLA
jgi:glycosyltransferase involved in cell wall biosynthesis